MSDDRKNVSMAIIDHNSNQVPITYGVPAFTTPEEFMVALSRIIKQESLIHSTL